MTDTPWADRPRDLELSQEMLRLNLGKHAQAQADSLPVEPSAQFILTRLNQLRSMLRIVFAICRETVAASWQGVIFQPGRTKADHRSEGLAARAYLIPGGVSQRRGNQAPAFRVARSRTSSPDP